MHLFLKMSPILWNKIYTFLFHFQNRAKKVLLFLFLFLLGNSISYSNFDNLQKNAIK